MAGATQCRSAAIAAVDVADYLRLVREDEEGTVAALRARRCELSDPLIAEYVARIANTAGDPIVFALARPVG